MVITNLIKRNTKNIYEFNACRDWTVGAPEVLSLWFYGDPDNDIYEQMYVKLNGVKKVYDGDPSDIAIALWQPWDIELASFGVNLNNVATFTIGLDRTGITGGSGIVFIDDIRLVSSPPVAP